MLVRLGVFPASAASSRKDWQPYCLGTVHGETGMSKSTKHCIRIPECEVPVPAELGSVGLCVSHFTWSVENTCAEMHREIALRNVTSERGAQVATYIGDSALLLARVISSQCLSDDLKKRILCSFVSLMNLRENLDRVGSSHIPEPGTPRSEVVPAFATVADRLNRVQRATSSSAA